jgi:aminopeptidase N
MRIPICMLVAVFLPPLVSAAQTKSRVFGDPALSQWPPSRTYHVENYLLKLHFDAARGEVFGDELVTLLPFQPRFRKFYLDSSRLEIDSVTLQPEQGVAVKLAFTQTDSRLWITLNHDYDAATVLKIRIVYHGFPKTGLFFVNPSTAYPR